MFETFPKTDTLLKLYPTEKSTVAKPDKGIKALYELKEAVVLFKLHSNQLRCYYLQNDFQCKRQISQVSRLSTSLSKV
jgi:hypothetical protein